MNCYNGRTELQFYVGKRQPSKQASLISKDNARQPGSSQSQSDFQVQLFTQAELSTHINAKLKKEELCLLKINV